MKKKKKKSQTHYSNKIKTPKQSQVSSIKKTVMKRIIQKPSKPVEAFNTVGVTFLGPSKTTNIENREEKENNVAFFHHQESGMVEHTIHSPKSTYEHKKIDSHNKIKESES